MSPKQGKRTTGGKGGSRRSDGLRRLALAGFGALVAVLFLIFAVAQGIGQPSVPEGNIALVEEVPDDIGHISTREFDRVLEQTAARSGLQEAPEPGDDRYEEIRTATIGTLLDMAWLEGQAAEMGVTVSEQEVDARLKEIRRQEFKNPREYRRFLRQAKFTPEDVKEQVRLQLLSEEIQQRVIGSAPEIGDAEIEDYYEASRDQFTQSASRDVRVILNKNRSRVEQAKEQLEKNDSQKTWNRVASRFSTDESSKDNGGLREGLTEGFVEEPLNSEIFAASEGELVGPVKTNVGWYVFQVEEATPERVQPLSEARQMIQSQLEQQAQQEAFTAFINDFGSKWKARTFCADGYVVENCSNFKPDAQLPDAPPACYEANPEEEPEACPAPVRQLQPALPGTVTVSTPQGQRLAQRPRPSGLRPEQSAVPGGLPPGIVPPTP